MSNHLLRCKHDSLFLMYYMDREREKFNKKSLLNASEISSEQEIDFRYKSSQYIEKEVEKIQVNERA